MTFLVRTLHIRTFLMAPYPHHITTDKCLAKVYRLWPSVAHRTTRSCRTRSWWSTTARSFGRWRGCRFESPTEESGLGRTWLKNKVRFYILGFFWVSTRISCSIGTYALFLFYYFTGITESANNDSIRRWKTVGNEPTASVIYVGHCTTFSPHTVQEILPH